MKSTPPVLLAPALAVAVWLSMLPLGSLVQGFSFAWEAALVLATGALAGFFLSLLRAPRPLIPFTQLLLMGGVLVWRGLAAMPGEPDEEWTSRLAQLWLHAMDAVQTGRPPIAPDPGVVWAVAGMAALLLLLTEILASQLEQPAWALAPLALPYLVGALSRASDLGWVELGCVALAFVIVLAATHGRSSGHLVRSASRVGANRVARGAQALALGSIAVLLSLLLTPLIPIGPKLSLGDGDSGPIQLSDPTAELTSNLQRPSATPVLRYTTSNGEGIYLRLVALTKLDSRGMHLVPMALSSIGLDLASTSPGEQIEASVEMAEVPSEYLPAPFAVDSFDADGQWAFDPATMSIVGTGPERLEQTAGLEYTTQSTVPNPDADTLRAAEAGRPTDADLLLEVPSLDDDVLALTERVVADAGTAGEKAIAIQSFLRSSEFTYSLSAPDSSNRDSLSEFLVAERSGYCIHFAAGMIAMARIEGIPARMAVGFTPGTPQPDGSYTVTTHDMHAWPELYFDDLGWVPFEPTPGGSTPPAHTDGGNEGQPSASPSPSPSASESTQEAPPTQDPNTPPSASPDDPGAAGSALGGWLLLVVGLLALLLAPAALRWGLRAWRLRSGQPAAQLADAVLAEIRATYVDTGRTWPEGSPLPAATIAADDLAPETGDLLLAVAEHVERIHFAPRFPDIAPLAADTKRLAAELRSSANPPGMRYLSVLLPRSLSPLRIFQKK